MIAGYPNAKCYMCGADVTYEDCACRKYGKLAVKAERERILAILESKKKPGTQPDKPKRGRPHKWPEVKVKTIKLQEDIENELLDSIIGEIKNG